MGRPGRIVVVPTVTEAPPTMKPAPADWPRISSSLFYQDPDLAIAWLGRAFGFEPRIIVEGEGGVVIHSELVFGDGVVMVSPAASRPWHRSPGALGGANSQALLVYVDDVEAHCARARAAGARIAVEPTTTDYGAEYWTDRTYEAVDLEEHHWWFAQRISTAATARRGPVRVREGG
jgi:uncharacterized glyoxalase superfamily protein PhnB